MSVSFEQKCNNFSMLIDKFAASHDCIFFDESGEGHDYETEDMFCEDVAGWLVPAKQRDEFINAENKFSEPWASFFVFAEWRKEDNEIKIDFVKYPVYQNDFADLQTKG